MNSTITFETKTPMTQSIAGTGIRLALRRPEAEIVLTREQITDLDLSDAVTETWRTDGTVYAWAFGGGEVRISIQDEDGKIDLNGAPGELLRGLFLSATWTGPDGEILGLDESEADALSDAMRDFTDADDLRRRNGAEERDVVEDGD